MADITKGAAAAAQDIRAFAEERLRYEFPYMKTETLDKLLAKIASVSQEGVIQQTDEMKDTLQRSSLFSLSAELRNAIYEEVLVEEYAIDMQDDLHRHHTNVPPPVPALLHVCRQVRREAAPIYYGANSFWASAHMVNSWYRRNYCKPLELWLSLIGPEQCKMIRSVLLDFQCISRTPPLSFNDNEFVEDVKRKYKMKGWGASFNEEVGIVSRREMVKTICRITRLGVSNAAIDIRFRYWVNGNDQKWVEHDSIVLPGLEEWEHVMNMVCVRDEVVSVSRTRAHGAESQDGGT